MGSFTAIREEACEANRALGASGLVDLTFGNVSVLDREAGVFAIKPSGVPYGDLTPDQMVLVDLAGKTVEGVLRPSSDTPTHLVLYASLAGIRAVVHTHSRYATSFAQAAREIPVLGTTHADYFRGGIPVTRALLPQQIAQDYETATGRVIVERFADLDPLAVPAVLVRNHGPFVWSDSGGKAVETAQALEIVAQMAWQALLLDPCAAPVSPEILDRHYSRKHGRGAYYGQPGQ